MEEGIDYMDLDGFEEGMLRNLSLLGLLLLPPPPPLLLPTPLRILNSTCHFDLL
tara:strand:- start:304 stop:465 length:162 start_codon:yes stop_codon:yes gene_type:complete